MFGYYEDSRLATETEACCEFARNVGIDDPDREWILTPFDSWVRNPAYTGKPGRHPEDDNYDDVEERAQDWFSCDELTEAECHALEQAS